jgi:hypothetical protein
MKSWVFTFRVEPPHMQTLMVKSGGSVFDAAYSRWLRQWYLVAGSYMEQIAEPQFIWCSDEYAREHPRESAHRQHVSIRQSKRPVQLSLSLS